MGDLTTCNPASGSAAGSAAGCCRKPPQRPLAEPAGRAAATSWARSPNRAPEPSGCSEFEPDLQAAAVHFKLGYLMFLEELNQLFQIFNIFLFHSFLFSVTRSAFRSEGRRCPCSKLNQGLGCWRQHLAAGSCNCHHILNANAKLACQVNPRLNRHNHARKQPGCLSRSNPWRLVNLQTDAVATGVGKSFCQSRLSQYAAGCFIHIPAACSSAHGPYSQLPALQALPHRLPALLRWDAPGRRCGSCRSSNPCGLYRSRGSESPCGAGVRR